MVQRYIVLSIILIIIIATVITIQSLHKNQITQVNVTTMTTINQSELKATGPCTTDKTNSSLLICKVGQNFTELKLLKIGLNAAQVLIYDDCPVSNQSNTSKCPPEIEWVSTNQVIQNCASGSNALESGLISTNINTQIAIFVLPPTNTVVGPCISMN